MKNFFCTALFLISLNISAQSNDSLPIKKNKNWTLSGYVKNMQTVYFIDSINPFFKDKILIDNLIHNRLNFKWYINKNFNVKIDLRNRISLGQLMEMSPDFGDRVDLNSSNPLLDRKAWYSPSWLILNRKDLVIHSMIDRFYLEFTNKQWEISIGRQRINWGINNFWNPNDIFNTYNFTDFDYEEKPGSDAVKLTYNSGLLSKLELAVQAFDAYGNFNGALLWQFNKKGYDFQLLSALSYRHIVGGFAWAGNIRKVGFKGENSYFWSLEDTIKNSFNSSLTADYIFKNSLFLNMGFLYNSNGSNANISSLFTYKISPRNLYPYRYNLLLSASYQINPLLNSSLAIVYSPGKSNALFISPNLSYSIIENWDLDLVAQIMCWSDKAYKSPFQMLFLRLKWSF